MQGWVSASSELPGDVACCAFALACTGACACAPHSFITQPQLRHGAPPELMVYPPQASCSRSMFRRLARLQQRTRMQHSLQEGMPEGVHRR